MDKTLFLVCWNEGMFKTKCNEITKNKQTQQTTKQYPHGCVHMTDQAVNPVQHIVDFLSNLTSRCSNQFYYYSMDEDVHFCITNHMPVGQNEKFQRVYVLAASNIT